MDIVVGEVKEGRARLNAALRRADTVAFALRRVGCCPEGSIDEAARAIVAGGTHAMVILAGTRCRMRLVALAGAGRVAEPGVATISLAHCVEHIVERLREERDVLSGVQFKDPVPGLLALEDKLAARYFADDGEPW